MDASTRHVSGPGPVYNPTLLRSGGEVVFGTGERASMVPLDAYTTPGPQYDTRLTLDGPAFTVGKALRDPADAKRRAQEAGECTGIHVDAPQLPHT